MRIIFFKEDDCPKCDSDHAGFDMFGNIMCPDCGYFKPNPLNDEKPII